MSKNKNRYKKVLSFLATGLMLGVTQTAFAGAYSLFSEQNVTNLGLAGAGAASLAEDASGQFYNPAGLVRSTGEEQIVLGGILIIPNSVLTATSLTDNTGLPRTPGKARVHGGGLVPSINYALRLSDCTVFGIGVNAPFGLKTNYHDVSPARYDGVRTELRVVDVSANLAHAFDNGFSVGAGADLYYGHAKVASKIGATVPVLGPLNDGFSANVADGWGYGAHVGVLWEPYEQLRVGAGYRSPFRICFSRGYSRFAFPSPTPTLDVSRFNVKAAVTFPETAYLSGYYEATEQLALMADLQWTHWKRFKELTLHFVNGGPVAETTLPENYKDSYRVAVGASYQFDCDWKGKLGFAFDKSPVRDEFRDVRVPDNDRYWLALGAQYRVTECLSLEAGYAHVFFKKANINHVSANRLPGAIGPARVTGSYRNAADLFGLQLVWDIA